MCHIPPATTGDEGWDRFGFAIKLEDYKRKLEERQLILCVRFNADGREWWDSNNGLNYTFTFSKSQPKRAGRASSHPALAGSSIQLSQAHAATLPGGRLTHRSLSPSSKIANTFGALEPSNGPEPRVWAFPKLASRLIDAPSRSESPGPTAPPEAFKAPTLPDIHTHLALSRYCAPSPPQSPPQEDAFSSLTTYSHTPEASTVSRGTLPARDARNSLGGQYAALPSLANSDNHDRRASWSGQSGNWDSFTTVMQVVEQQLELSSTDGESTPVAPGSRSPAAANIGDSEDSSLAKRPFGLKRSTGDLRALVDDVGLVTPPSSAHSSPPSPALQPLPPMSPSPSSTSTGDSSPINTASTDSTPDLSSLSVDIEPVERGRDISPNNYKMLSTSYQEFVSRNPLLCRSLKGFPVGQVLLLSVASRNTEC